MCRAFERRYNDEQLALADIHDEYAILKLKPVDDEGNPYPNRITGYDVTPKSDHDILSALSIRDAFGYDIPYIIDGMSASEYLRSFALTVAKTWNQPTEAEIRRNIERKRSGR